MPRKPPLVLDAPLVKVAPPRGQVQTKAGDERRSILATAMAHTLRTPLKDAAGHHYRIAAVWFEELPK
jgi:hypothetical protein